MLPDLRAIFGRCSPLLVVQGASFLGIALCGYSAKIYQPDYPNWALIQTIVLFLATSLDFISSHISVARSKLQIIGFKNRQFVSEFFAQTLFLVSLSSLYLYFDNVGVDLLTVCYLSVIATTLFISQFLNVLLLSHGMRHGYYIDGLINFITPFAICFGYFITLIAILTFLSSLKAYLVIKQDAFNPWISMKKSIVKVCELKLFAIVRSYFPVFLIATLSTNNYVSVDYLFIVVLAVRIVTASSAFLGNYYGIRFVQNPGFDIVNKSKQVNIYLMVCVPIFFICYLIATDYLLILSFLMLEIRFIIFAKDYYVSLYTARRYCIATVALILLSAFVLSAYSQIFLLLTFVDLLILYLNKSDSKYA